MIRLPIMITLIILIQSCNSKSVYDKLDQLYGDNGVNIDDVEVKVIYLPEGKFAKIKNLFLMNSLYAEKDSLLSLKDEKYKEQYKLDSSCYTKMNENRTKLNQNSKEHIQLIKELNKEIQNFESEIKNSLKYYVLWYKKNHNKKFSMILDQNLKVVFAQDPLLKNYVIETHINNH